MQTQLLQSLPHKLYPAESVHAQHIREHFGAALLRPLTDAEHAELSAIKLFLIVFGNRTGSNYLTELLHQAGIGVYSMMEPFNARQVLKVSVNQQLPSLTDYLIHLVRQHAKQGAAGFKISVSQLFDLTRLGLLGHFGVVKLIHTRRHDLLAQAVSHSKARRSGQWMDRGEGEAAAEVPYDRDDILICLNAITERHAQFEYYSALHQIPQIEMVYEDLVADPGGAVVRVAEFLDVPARLDDVVPGQVSLKQQRDETNRLMQAQFEAEFRLGALHAE